MSTEARVPGVSLASMAANSRPPSAMSSALARAAGDLPARSSARSARAYDLLSATVPLSAVPKTATYLGDWEAHPGFLTLLSDGETLTGAYALGPEAGEWMAQATVAIRARVPLDVLADTIQPFPTFSEAFHFALEEIVREAGRAGGSRAGHVGSPEVARSGRR